MARAALRGRPPPRRGARGKGPCRAPVVFRTAGTASLGHGDTARNARGGRPAIPTPYSTHLGPLFSPHLLRGSGCSSAGGEGLHPRPCSASARSPCGGSARRGGGAMPARSEGAARSRLASREPARLGRLSKARAALAKSFMLFVYIFPGSTGTR